MELRRRRRRARAARSAGRDLTAAKRRSIAANCRCGKMPQVVYWIEQPVGIAAAAFKQNEQLGECVHWMTTSPDGHGPIGLSYEGVNELGGTVPLAKQPLDPGLD
jgi:hypothetical protein